MVFGGKDKNDKTYNIAGLIGGFGFTTAGVMAGGYFLGSYLDKKLGTSPWFMLLLILLGIVGSFIEFFKLVTKLSNENRKDDKR